MSILLSSFEQKFIILSQNTVYMRKLMYFRAFSVYNERDNER
jgi:hypothetical protein